MLRTMLLLLAGAAIGAAAWHFAGDGASRPVGGEPYATTRAPGGTQGSTDPEASAALEEQALAIAAEPPSGDRTLRLAALLVRYGESDPAGAVRLSRRVRTDSELTRLLFTAWAEADFDGAMAELPTFPPDEAREIALRLLRSLGNDDRRTARLAEFLPADERARFLADAVAARAEAAPLAALRQALTIDDAAARGLALSGLARTWGRRDPRQALLQLPELRDEQERTTFRDAVVYQWAVSEPVAALDYVLELDAAAQQRLAPSMLHQVPASELGRLLAIAGRFDGPTGAMLRQSAVQRMAQDDPAAALAELERLPAHERRGMQSSIAHSYGAKNPQAAFAWAQSLQPRDPQIVMSVLNGIAQASPEQAFDLAMSLSSAGEREQAIGMVASIGFPGRDNSAMLDRVLAIGDAGARHRAMLGVLSSWSATDPGAVFDWLATNQDRVPSEAFQQLARQLAFADPVAAAAYTPRVPQSARGGWLAAVAGAYAQRDPEAALAWIAQYRGDPAYPDAVGPIASVIAQRDGATAVRLLEESGQFDPSNVQTVMSVAMSWAQQDPAAAAAWALNLGDARLRMSALSLAVQQWSARNPESARRWAFGLQPGDARDDALNGLVTAPFGEALPDEEVLAAFSTERARNRALIVTAMRVAQSSGYEQGRALLARVTDPAERARAQSALDQVRSGPFGPVGATVIDPRLGIPLPGGFRALGPARPDGIVALPPQPEPRR